MGGGLGCWGVRISVVFWGGVVGWVRGVKGFHGYVIGLGVVSLSVC